MPRRSGSFPNGILTVDNRKAALKRKRSFKNYSFMSSGENANIMVRPVDKRLFRGHWPVPLMLAVLSTDMKW